MISIVTKLLSIWVFITQLFILAILFYFLFFQKNKSFIKNNFGKVIDFLKKNAIMFAFFVALVAMMGSLFYSEIAGYSPCKLCWYQRILMYPLVLVFLIAWLKKDKKVYIYALPVAVLGALIALYHNYTYYMAQVGIVCSFGGSCAKQYILGLGYITIPMMSLTAFILVIIVMFLLKSEQDNN